MPATLEQRAAARGADLVLEGGGVRGIALAGAVVGLAERGVVFPRIGGTSAGAIVGALAAAYESAGMPITRIRDDLDALDLATLESKGPLERVTGPIGKAGAFLTRSGLYRTDRLREWLAARLEEAGVRTFRDLKITADPGSDLEPQQRYRLVTHVTDLTRRCLVRVPWDLPHYLLPEGAAAPLSAQIAAIDAYPVVDAVVASASLPFFFQPFEQRTPEGVCTWVDGGLLQYFPITVFDRLREWLAARLEEAGVRTFRDLKITGDPGSDLEPQQRYRLVTHVTDLTRRCLVRVPWDLPHYLLPEGAAAPLSAQIAAIDAYPVVDAVVASASLPFFFQPFEQRTPEGVCTWVDGGLLQYFPITVFDRTDGRRPRWPTWGVRLTSAPPAAVPDRAIGGPLGEAIGLLETAIGQWNRYVLEDEGVDARTVLVDASGVSSTDFEIDAATRKRLYDNGYRAANAFLAAHH